MRFEQRKNEPDDLFLLRVWSVISPTLPENALSAAVNWIVAKSKARVLDAIKENERELRELEERAQGKEVGRG